jgi:integrase
MRNEKRLTKRVLDSLKADDGAYFAWDSDIAGFGARVHPTGRVTFVFQYRSRAGRQRRLGLGTYGVVTVEQARQQAKVLAGEVAAGGDPGGQREEQRKAATFAEFADAYMKDAQNRLGNRAMEEAQRRVEQILKPAWGKKKLEAIRPGDVAALHRRLAEKRERDVMASNAGRSYRRETGGPVTANRCLALLKVMFNTAEAWGMIPKGSNPAVGLKMLPEKSRERYLTPDELARLADALNDAQANGTASPWAVGAIKLLMFTGCRRDEILTLQWSFIDAEGRCLRLPESKTGAKVVYLNAPALEVLTDLAKLREAGNPYVIVGHVAGARLVNLTKPWYRILKAAGLEGLRLHDLRHVYAGMGAALGLGLPVVGKLLGHTQAQTTQRYANLAPDPVAAAAERIGEALLEAMDKGRARVVELNARPAQPGGAREDSGERSLAKRKA